MSFKTIYALPRQIKTSILELSIRKAKATLLLSSFFISCEESDYSRVVSVGHLGLTAARTEGTATVGVKLVLFFRGSVHSVFPLGPVIKCLLLPSVSFLHL